MFQMTDLEDMPDEINNSLANSISRLLRLSKPHKRWQRITVWLAVSVITIPFTLFIGTVLTIGMTIDGCWNACRQAAKNIVKPRDQVARWAKKTRRDGDKVRAKRGVKAWLEVYEKKGGSK